MEALCPLLLHLAVAKLYPFFKKKKRKEGKKEREGERERGRKTEREKGRKKEKKEEMVIL